MSFYKISGSITENCRIRFIKPSNENYVGYIDATTPSYEAIFDGDEIRTDTFNNLDNWNSPNNSGATFALSGGKLRLTIPQGAGNTASISSNGLYLEPGAGDFSLTVSVSETTYGCMWHAGMYVMTTADKGVRQYSRRAGAGALYGYCAYKNDSGWTSEIGTTYTSSYKVVREGTTWTVRNGTNDDVFLTRIDIGTEAISYILFNGGYYYAPPNGTSVIDIDNLSISADFGAFPELTAVAEKSNGQAVAYGKVDAVVDPSAVASNITVVQGLN